MAEHEGLDRRAFLRKAALTGATVAWATPVVQTVAVTPAFASPRPPPPPPADWSACVGACQEAPNACPPGHPTWDPQNTGCQVICTMLCGDPNQGLPCCNSDVLQVDFWCSITGRSHGACYFGSLSGCPGATYNASCCGGRNAICASKAGPTDQCQCS